MEQNMRKPSILILDDEELAASYLEELIQEVKLKNSFFSNFDIISTTNYQEFLNKIKTNLPEIVFLDIEMPIKNGLDIAKEIRENYLSIGYTDFQFPLLLIIMDIKHFLLMHLIMF